MLKRMRVKSLKRRRLRTGAIAALGVVLLLGGLFFSLRNVILRSVLDSRIRSYEATHAGDILRVGTARFSGLAAIDLENIQVLAAAKDLAATVKKCSVEINFLKMLRGRVRLKRLALSDVILDLSREVLPGPLPTGSSDTGVTSPPRTAPGPPLDFGARGARLLDLYFALIPDSLEIERLTLHSVFGDVRQGLFFPAWTSAAPPSRPSSRSSTRGTNGSICWPERSRGRNGGSSCACCPGSAAARPYCRSSNGNGA